MYALVTCVGDDITFPTGITVDRITLTYIVVSIDIAICVSYFIFLAVIEKCTNIEEFEINNNKLNLCDFSVAVKNLPSQSEYKTTENLRVMLAKHFKTLLAGRR